MLAQIDHRSATIVRAIGIDGERATDVGARLSMSEGAVRVAFHRAVRKLATLARGSDR
jgi:RNA polymerase sigma-70 factor (ECF subfamily)